MPAGDLRSVLYRLAAGFGYRMIIRKSHRELEKMRASGRLVAQVLAELERIIEPGVSTWELNEVAEQMILAAGAHPTFKGYHGFKYTLCTSPNEMIVHGFPTKQGLNEGDIISIDCGVTLNGYVGDSAITVPVGQVSDDKLKLIRVAKECLERAIAECRPGNRLGDIGYAVESHAARHGYGVVRDHVGHGVGRKMHEDPQVPNYGVRGKGVQLKSGFTIAIEPMLNMGTHETLTLKDKWQVVTKDGKPSVHVEHTVAITETGHEVLTRRENEKPPLAVEKHELVGAF